jgi:hypothetical protein
MELCKLNGKLVWLKKDGTVSLVEVKDITKIKYYGYQWEKGIFINSVIGEPELKKIILIRYYYRCRNGYMLLSAKGEKVFVEDDELYCAIDIVKNPPVDEQTLPQTLSERSGKSLSEITKRALTVDISAIANQKGLVVYVRQNSDSIYIPEYGLIDNLPKGWGFLRSGDAKLTRAIRKEFYWICNIIEDDYNKSIGTFAPIETIRKAYDLLGSNDGALERFMKERRQCQKQIFADVPNWLVTHQIDLPYLPKC